ncbi:hypothetical protein PBY51_003435 [Eleginops maclovinus]|uniref:Uncharacterized protein n=1 Tax=Eleginops maclovinus TaxID=56733 RepID=A0AAN8ASC4_ELEMC|nr:hypothetical protein PBY51_003435 [Eleginops maclovinus]
MFFDVKEERQSRATADQYVSQRVETPPAGLLFVFGLKLQQYLRPRQRMSLLSRVPWDVCPPCSSPDPEQHSSP